MNIFDLFISTSVLVQISITLLIWLSIMSWSIIFNRIFVFHAVQYALKMFEKKFWSGIELSNLYHEILTHRNKLNSPETIFHAGFEEFSKLCQKKIHSTKLVISRTSHAMQTSIDIELKKLEKYISLIGTIGSISPYIGLFGTVLGIIHVFIELGKTNNDTTNNQIIYIQVIAPGIAEALISTALGLFVAIPAVIAFNCFNTKIDNFDQNYRNFVEEFTTILYHQVSLNFDSDLNKDNQYEETTQSKI